MPRPQAEEVEDDFAAEEENKLINEVLHPRSPASVYQTDASYVLL